jgi:hypothetical protein
MKAKTWDREVKRDCAGIGKGRLFSAREILNILKKGS